MLLSTIGIQGFTVDEYLGIVTGTAIRGSGFVKDFFSRVTDLFGGKARGYELDFEKAKEEAMGRMAGYAEDRGASAVTGISISVATFSTGKGGLFIVTATGTAVRGRMSK